MVACSHNCFDITVDVHEGEVDDELGGFQLENIPWYFQIESYQTLSLRGAFVFRCAFIMHSDNLTFRLRQWGSLFLVILAHVLCITNRKMIRCVIPAWKKVLVGLVKRHVGICVFKLPDSIAEKYSNVLWNFELKSPLPPLSLSLPLDTSVSPVQEKIRLRACREIWRILPVDARVL